MSAPDKGPLPMLAGDRRSRRAFLLSVLFGALTAAGCGERDSSPGGSAPAAALASDWLPAAVGDVKSAARIGRAYLDGQPGEQNLDGLLDAIDAALAPVLGSRPSEPARVLGALQRAVRSEYRRGETAAVGGWVLSRTEVQVYAALALRESG